MYQDAYHDIKAKVAQINHWHSFASRFCYAYCRVIFAIVGALVGTAISPTAYYLITRPPTMPGEAFEILGAIGGIVGLIAGLYTALVAARFIKALAFFVSRAVDAAKHYKAHDHIKDNADV